MILALDKWYSRLVVHGSLFDLMEHGQVQLQKGRLSARDRVARSRKKRGWRVSLLNDIPQKNRDLYT